MKLTNVASIAVAGLIVYLIYLFFQQSDSANGGPGNLGTTIGGPGGASNGSCTAQICAGSPLSL